MDIRLGYNLSYPLGDKGATKSDTQVEEYRARYYALLVHITLYC